MPLDGSEFGAHLRELPKGSVREARAIMRETAREALILARQNVPRRSGRLARSLRTSPLWKNARGQAGFYFRSRHPAARITELGGRIVPRSVSYLAIPLRGQRAWPRHRGRHIVIRARSGRLYLFGKRPRDGGVPLWELRRHVDIPAQPYIAPALRQVRANLLQRLPRAVLVIERA
ncbi:MAG: HK97 gp10 family phage protein [Chthoniobacterales bacterium]